MANRFVGNKVTKKVKFLNAEIDISKLSVSQVVKIQEQAKVLEENPTEQGNLQLLFLVVRQGAEELSELSDEDMGGIAMDELTKLSAEIMKYSGLGGGNKQDSK
jgi:hypothetical protein